MSHPVAVPPRAAKKRPRLAALLVAGLWLAGPCANAGIGPEERLPLLSARIATTPTDARLYLRRALIYADLNEFKLAFGDVETAAQFGPRPDTYFVRALLLYRLGQFDQAVSFLNQYLRAHPDNGEALLYRARILRDAGKREPALRDYLRYLKTRPDAEPGEYLTAAQLMVELADQGRGRGRGQHSHQEAVRFLDARIRQLGVAPQFQRYAIEIEQQDCQATQVLARLDTLGANARRAPIWHFQAAEQYLMLGDPRAARQALDAGSALLAERPASTEKAELTNLRDFLVDVLAIPPGDAGRRSRLQATRAKYYPEAPLAPASATSPAAPGWRAGTRDVPTPASGRPHMHTVLGGFEQPHAAVGGYQPAWAEAVKPVYACLRDGRSGKR